MTKEFKDSPKFNAIGGDYVLVTGIEDLVVISEIDMTAKNPVTIAMTPDQARALAAGIVAAAEFAESSHDEVRK